MKRQRIKVCKIKFSLLLKKYFYKQNQRALNKAMRDLDRERMKMDQQEKKVIADIKKLAKDNQMDAVKIMAKDLVRTRRQSRKFMLMKANIQVRIDIDQEELY